MRCFALRRRGLPTSIVEVPLPGVGRYKKIIIENFPRDIIFNIALGHVGIWTQRPPPELAVLVAACVVGS